MSNGNSADCTELSMKYIMNTLLEYLKRNCQVFRPWLCFYDLVSLLFIFKSRDNTSYGNILNSLLSEITGGRGMIKHCIGSTVLVK